MDPNLEAFVVDVGRSRSMDECLDILAEHVAALGFLRVLYAYTPTPKASDGNLRPPPVQCRNFPQGWKRHWPDIRVHDPYYRVCFDGHLTIDWTWLRRERRMTAAEREVCSYMYKFGMDRGLTVPIHLPNGAFAGMSAVWKHDGDESSWAALVQQRRSDVFLTAHHFHAAVQNRFCVAAHWKGPSLTPRESEVLHWVARGKTSSDIAIIVDRSTETVRFHLKNAMRKLNAVNRIQAVIKASQLGIIELPPT